MRRYKRDRKIKLRHLSNWARITVTLKDELKLIKYVLNKFTLLFEMKMISQASINSIRDYILQELPQKLCLFKLIA